MSATATPSRQQAADAFRRLITWAAAAPDDAPLPKSVLRRAALILADDVGAMVAAAEEPQVAAARSGFAANSRGPEVTVFASGSVRLDRFAAAAANGMAATWCELDEGFRAAPCHAGAYLLPALLAEAEHRGARTDEVLSALAVAYEITARVALAFPFATMTVHPHAAFATIGAAAGAGLMRRLDAARLLDAVSSAASMSFAGPFGHATEGALIRNGWTSAGAWIGMQAVDWSAAGIGGLAETPYDVFVTVFGTGCKPQELTAGLGESWAVDGGYHKVFACCQYAHSAVEATLDLHARLRDSGRSADDLAEILVETHPRGLTLTTVEPATVLAAKFSMPHAAAATALLGTGGQAAFTNATLDNSPIATLRRKVRLSAHPEIGDWPQDRPARVSWLFSDGENWVASCASARGGADQPFDEATMIDKLTENSRQTFPQMANVLASLVSGERSALQRPWRETVASMTTPRS